MPVANPSLGNLEDVRHLRDVIANLQQRLTKLEQSALPFAVNQKGALPGFLRAIQIGDFGMKSAMVMNFANGPPGQGTYASVTDPSGVVRAEWGNLAANGVSPQQFGFRANNAAGTPIFDSLGLIATVTVLGSAINFSQQSVTGNGSFQTVSGSTVSFTLTRATNILALGSGQLLDPTVGDTGFVLSCAVLVDSAFSSTNGPQVFNTTNGALPVTPFAVVTALASGAHSMAFGVQQTNAKLWSVTNGYLYVFSLGA